MLKALVFITCFITFYTTHAQWHEDIPMVKNTANLHLQGAVKQIIEEEILVDIETSTTKEDSTINDTTYTILSNNIYNFDSTGHLIEKRFEELNKRGKVKHTTTTIYSYQQNKLKTITHKEGGDIIYTKKLTYDMHDLLDEVFVYDDKGDQQTRTQYSYKGTQPFNIRIKDANNAMKNFIRLTYYNNGKLREREYRGESLQLINKQKHVYDTISATVTRVNIYNYAADDNINELHTYQYEHEQVIQETITDSNKRVTLYRTIDYDINGDSVKVTDFVNDIKEGRSYEYERDQEGNIITQYIFIEDILTTIKKRMITYYKKEE